MQVSIKLVGVLVDRLPDDHPLDNAIGTNDVELLGAPIVADLLRHVGLAPESEYFAMINGDHVPAEALSDTVLNEGDAVVLVPPMKGG